MKKKITICGKEYEICTNAFCMFEYKKQFKTGIIADIGRMNEYNIKVEEVEKKCKQEGREEDIEQEVNRVALEEFDNIIQIPLQLAYTFIKVADRNFMSFEDWLMTIEDIKIEDSWIAEVTELAVNSFLGQGTRGTTESIKEQSNENK